MTPTSSHAYGIGLIAVIVGAAVGVSYYQLYYLPELNAKPVIAEEILHPTGVTHIEMVKGAANPEQKDNFIPKQASIQLSIDNDVMWTNKDETAHTVTPDDPYKDAYTGEFGSDGVVKPGETYEFLFTDEAKITYHCTPHPWMKGSLEITKQRF
ncbi:MAG TPA: plastocyanin/azurin family copper-binding protein [Candidatus Nitrosotenuis sp.]|nr:plastocyanin/azurin family copper-binding protein [Candidatus Nitrosotenuis sp.]